MHRVLSYQTAMRASGSRDVREYVTKRTCVSLILSIAFFTLIAGFLLGKFVSDRQYHIKHINELHAPPKQRNINELHAPPTQQDHALSVEFLEYKRASNELMQRTRILSEQLQMSKTSPKPINQSLFNKYVACVQEVPDKYNEVVDIFLENLITSQAEKHIECLGLLKDYINTILTY